PGADVPGRGDRVLLLEDDRRRDAEVAAVPGDLGERRVEGQRVPVAAHGQRDRRARLDLEYLVGELSPARHRDAVEPGYLVADLQAGQRRGRLRVLAGAGGPGAERVLVRRDASGDRAEARRVVV